jgi:hypothetical protein
MTAIRTSERPESRAADLLGARRQVCSRPSRRDDVTYSDSTYEQPFIESKLRRKHAVLTLHYNVRRQAAKEGKVPVLALHDKHQRRFLLVIHSDDPAVVLVEYAIARDDPKTEQFNHGLWHR